MKTRTNRGFSKLPDTDLSKFAGKIITGLTGNVQFPAPPVAAADLAMIRAALMRQ